jgi:hypothetical protein
MITGTGIHGKTNGGKNKNPRRRITGQNKKRAGVRDFESREREQKSKQKGGEKND